MTLNQIFTNGAVLQAGKAARFFGEGDGIATVKIGNVEASARSKDGKWLVELPPFEYGGPYTVEIDLDGKCITLSDVYFGDVYLLVGQSNLQFKLRESTTPKETYKSNPLMRVFTLDRIEEGEPFKTADGWIKCGKETAGGWSAVGYHLAETVNEMSGNAVGIISAYQGASIIQSWLPTEVATREEFFVPDELRSYDFKHPNYSRWNRDGELYSFTIEKILPYSISHVIWYQGESNTADAEAAIYGKMLTALIETSREIFKDTTLPFVVTQIADFDERQDDAWRVVQQKAAEVAEAVPYVALAKARDYCETDDIHPRTKSTLAYHIASLVK